MPLKVDKLVASSVQLETLTINGTEVQNKSQFVGKLNSTGIYVTINETETIIDSLKIPANTFYGFTAPVNFSVNLECSVETYGYLVTKLYVSETPTIDGVSPFYQNTFNNVQDIGFSDSLLVPSMLSTIGEILSVEILGDKVTLFYQNNFTNKTVVEVFDNFNFSKDLYLIVTGEKSGDPLDVKSQQLAVSTFPLFK